MQHAHDPPDNKKIPITVDEDTELSPELAEILLAINDPLPEEFAQALEGILPVEIVVLEGQTYGPYEYDDSEGPFKY